VVTVFARQNDDGTWRLWTNSFGQDAPAGTRLNRGGIFPYETLGDHPTEQEAKVAAGRLQVYWDDREMTLRSNRKRKNRWQ
jgi:hypothetical protein